MVRLVGVRKRYGRGPDVLAGVDLELEPGRPTAVGGVNGSGKSTLLRVVAGCELPTAGRVHGRPARVGYLPDRFPASARMPVAAYLRHLAAVHGAPASGTAAMELLAELGFTGEPGSPVARLSKGNVQKVGLAQALGCGAGLLVLDEPWSGLDAAAATALTARLAAAAEAGTVVVIADHTGAAAQLAGAHRVRLDAGIVLPDKDSHPAPPAPADAPGLTVELAWDGDPAEVVAGLPPVRTWRAVAGGLVVELPQRDGDALLLAALRLGCSVVEVRRVPVGPA